MQAYFFNFVCLYVCACTFKNVWHASDIQDVLEFFQLNDVWQMWCFVCKNVSIRDNNSYEIISCIGFVFLNPHLT